MRTAVLIAGVLSLSTLSSCATTADVTSNVWFGVGIEINRVTGIPHIVSHTTSHSMDKVNEVARGYCAKQGFTELVSLTLTSKTHAYYTFDFECNKTPTATRPIQQPSSEVDRLRAEAEASRQRQVDRLRAEAEASRQRQRQLEEQLNQARQPPPPARPVSTPNTDRLSLDASKVKCTDLGFKPGTEAHGKCVLQLSK